MAPEDIRPEDFLDPDDPRIYEDVEQLVKRYGGEKAIFAHVWGVVENLYGFIGVEQTLLLMTLDPDLARDLFERLCEFSTRVARNLCAMGIDVLHISGDVGANNAMIMSPDLWRTAVRPFDVRIIKPGREAGLPISLHSCGFVEPILPDLIEAGVQVVHPIQETAGMDQTEVKREFGDRLTIHGGLDVRELPRMTTEQVEATVREKMATLKPGGGFIFNTGHTVQPDTPLEHVERAYAAAREYGVYA